MPRRKQIHPVELTLEQQHILEELTSKGAIQVRVYKRARVLLLSAAGHTDQEVCELVGISNPTMKRIRKSFALNGLDGTLYEATRSGRPSIFDADDHAKITALACSAAPEGYAQWSLQLLADKAIELKIVETISDTTVRKILKKTRSRRTSNASGVSQR